MGTCQTPVSVRHAAGNKAGTALSSHSSQFSGERQIGFEYFFFFIMVKYLPYLNILNEEKEQMVFWKMKYNPLETVAEK